MAHELVSVIVPAYDARKTIEACLGALLAQDYPALEIILVDDGSSDTTALVASGFGVQVLVNARSVGSGGARNRGAAQAKGHVLLFLDSDVVLPPNAISEAYAKFIMLEKEGCLAIGAVYSTNTGHLNLASDYKNLDLSFRGNQSAGYNKYIATYFSMLRKDTFLKAGGFSTEYAVEDIEFFYRVSKGNKNLFVAKEILVDHLKQYSLFSMLRTNHRRIAGMMKVIRDSDGKNMAGEAADRAYMLNILLPNSILVALLAGPSVVGIPLTLMAMFLLINRRFLLFIYSMRGWKRASLAIGVMFVEYLLVPYSIVSSYARVGVLRQH